MITPVTGKLVINYSARERFRGRLAWCELPYPGHKRGCPNYGKSCPLPRVEEYYDLTKPHWFAVVRFNLQKHAERMLSLHSEWSNKQCRCLLYWQNSVKKKLDGLCQRFIDEWDNGMIYHKIPEAMGVNVMLTAKRIGIKIETKPKKYVHKIALIGFPGEWHKKERGMQELPGIMGFGGSGIANTRGVKYGK